MTKLKIKDELNSNIFFPRHAPKTAHFLAATFLMIFSLTCNADTAVPVSAINTADIQSDYQFLTNFNNKMYFRANDGISGEELWVFDKANNSTLQVADISAGSSNSSPSYLTIYNERLYFGVTDYYGSGQLWSHDSNTNATMNVSASAYFSADATLEALTVYNDKLYFAGFVDRRDYGWDQLYAYDSATNSFSEVTALNSSSIGWPPYLTVYDEKLYFAADDDSSGYELWVYNSITDTTLQVADINKGSSGSSPRSFTVYNNKLYFVANDGLSGYELWVYDNATDTASPVDDINKGSLSSSPSSFKLYDNKLYFVANDGSSGDELWVYNSTTDTVLQIADINEGSLSSSPRSFTVYNDKLYFAANNGISGYELWAHSSSTGNTFQVLDILEGAASSEPTELTVYNETLYFNATTAATGRGLYRLNHPPVITVESNHTASEREIFQMEATATDLDGDDLTYQWEQLDGPELTLQDSNNQTLAFTAPEVDENTIINLMLTVSDGAESVEKPVFIEVIHINRLPQLTLNITNLTVNEKDSVTLSASATDEDDDELSAKWVRVEGDTEILVSNSLNYTFVAQDVNTTTNVTYKITVSDGEEQVSDTVQVIINNVKSGGSENWLTLALLILLIHHRFRRKHYLA